MLPKGPYNPIQIEGEILAFWKKGKFNKPEYHPKKGLQKSLKGDKRKPFCIICPPPNANARPHIGNISGYSYQDLMGRFNRMNGKKVLLFPGKDHAGIQSEAVYERDELKPQGKTKLDFTRDEFYKQCYDFCVDKSKIARADEERIGLSADFDRDVFTLDPAIVDIILSTFIELHKDKKIYKGIRITNWCPHCMTALADADTERKSRETQLSYIKYPLKDSKEFITIATTRPETMLADTAVAVNPKDKRYTNLIGKKAILPLLNRELPIITDPQVDTEFGTGVLKITPAHANDDYEIMLRWNKKHPKRRINYINVIWKDSKLYGPVGKYKGMAVAEAQKAVLEDLRRDNLIEKIEKIEQNISVCERCKNIIEPIMSSQWYVKIDKLQKLGIDAVKSSKIKIHPKYMQKRYFQWMENLRDWPISRSLWWGYRIPAWYRGELEEYIDEDGQIVEKIDGEPLNLSRTDQIKVQIESPGKGWIQDKDVFDTWFSSGQWPYAVLMKENLMSEFYPTDVMETGFDILELWVSRMIMLGLFKTKEIPFSDIFLHGVLRAKDGQKMSKSRGNIVNMDDVVQEHGADTLRLFYFIAGKAGSHYRFDWERIKFNRNLLNKVWNASKFVLSNLKDTSPDKFNQEELDSSSSRLREYEKGTIEHLNKTIASVTKFIKQFKFNLALETLYESFWHTFCDQCIETSKKYLYSQEEQSESTKWMLWKSLKTYIELFHPFAPFITEKIWQEIPKSADEPETVMYVIWPEKISYT